MSNTINLFLYLILQYSLLHIINCQNNCGVADLSFRKEDCSCIYGYYENSQLTCTECPERYDDCTDELTPVSCRGDNRKDLQEDCECLDNYIEDDQSHHCKYNNVFHDKLHAYYPFKDGSLQDVYGNSGYLIFNKYPEKVPDRLYRTDEAFDMQARGSYFKWEDNWSLNNYDGFSVFIRAQTQKSNTSGVVSSQNNFIDVELVAGVQTIDAIFEEETGNTSQLIETLDWYTFTITFKFLRDENQIIVKFYVDSTLVHEQTHSDLDLQNLLATQIYIGHPYSNIQYTIDDLALYNRELYPLDIEKISSLQTYLTDYDPNKPERCAQQLRFLESRLVYIDLELREISGTIYQFYTIDFDHFELWDECYDIELYLGNTENIVQYTLSDDLKQIFISFPNDEASDKGCIQDNEHEIECQFQLNLAYNGHYQMTKFFNALLLTPDLENIQNGLQLQILNDYSDELTIAGNRVSTEVNICLDSSCQQYYPSDEELYLVRNEITYVELKVNTPEFQSYYPVHKSFKLDGKEFLPENLVEIQNWDQAGRIIYQIRPHQANGPVLLQIQIGLAETLDSRRFLQNSDKQNFKDQDILGKQVYLEVIDKQSLQNEKEQSNVTFTPIQIVGLVFGSLAFILLITVIIAITVTKIKKMKSQETQKRIVPLNCITEEKLQETHQQEIIKK